MGAYTDSHQKRDFLYQRLLMLTASKNSIRYARLFFRFKGKSRGFIPAFALTLSAFALNAACALDAKQQTEMVTAHSKYRSQVGVPVLIWSATLAEKAQAYADKLYATQACKPIHSHVAGLGENLFWASGIRYSNGTSEPQVITPTQVTDSWGSEGGNYSHDSNTCVAGKVCGHYTQIVWKATTHLGCGNAVCDDNTQIWVCNYAPAGNAVGERPY